MRCGIDRRCAADATRTRRPGKAPRPGHGRHACYAALLVALIASACGDEAAVDAGREQAAAFTPTSARPHVRNGEHSIRRRAQIRERARTGPADIVLLGDSITEGWHWAGRAVIEKAFSDASVANLGISGDRTEDVLGRLQGDLEGFDPRLILLLIGTNNLGRDGPAEVVAGIGAIVEALAALRPDAEIVLLALLPRGFAADSPERKAVAAVNRLLEGEARAWPVTWLDVGDAITEPDSRLVDRVSPDGLHLSEIGYARWWRAMEPTVEASRRNGPGSAPD